MRMTAHSEAVRIDAVSSWRITVKRVVDVLASAIGLALLTPLFALIAVAIWREDGGPVFYRQARVGRAGRLFEINKFRSMTPAPRGSGSHFTLTGDPRVTRTGAFLRRAKLDELPQLLNVLIGDMSLIGPRPESPELIIHYAPSERAVILSVRPGMTDYASVLLRNESDLLAQARDPARFYRERLMPLKYELCVRYVNEIGLWTDVRIVLATIWSIVIPSMRNPLIDRAIAGRYHGLGATGIDDVA
jgi:lipopolysaccharide/colanic/teichoic acid biosynthesis glycosyltransferase